MSKSERKSDISADRKPTTIFQKPFEGVNEVCNLPLFKKMVDKENFNSQKLGKLGWPEYLKSLQLAADRPQKKSREYIELESETDPNQKYKFPIYTDKQLGIPPALQTLLRETYENDDDVNTRESVMEFFVEVCKKDLIQGVNENQAQVKDKNGYFYKLVSNPITNFANLQSRLREFYDKLDSKDKHE